MPRPWIPAPNTAQVRMHLLNTLSNYEVMHTFYILSTSNWLTTDLESIATFFQDWFFRVYAGVVSHIFQLIEMEARDMSIEGGEVFSFTPDPALYGTVNRSPLTASITKAITLRTGLAGRSQRGRIFIPTLCDFMYNGANSMDETYIADVLTRFENLRTSIPMVDVRWEWVVASWRHNHAWRAEAQLTAIRGVGIHDLRLSTQKRRLIRAHP